MTTESAPIRTLIAGLGRAGWDIHRPAIQSNPAYRIVGVVEPVPERQREAEVVIGCPAYATLEEALGRSDAELAIIATPSGGHGPEGLLCLQHGLHVVIDKPMCQSVAEADALITLARERGLVLTSYHPYRFCPVFRTIRRIIHSGMLGRLVEIRMTHAGFFRRNDWVMKRARGGGMHNVWGSHVIDQCLQVAASPVTAIFSDMQTTVTPGDADDHFKALLKCENGTVIDVEVSNCRAIIPETRWIVVGTCGSLTVDKENQLRVKYFDPTAAPPIVLQDGPAQQRRYDNDDQLPWREEALMPDDQTGTPEFFPNVAAAIRHAEPLIITPESVRETIRILEVCREQNPHIWGEVLA